ncbi:hypothetical protein BDV28DRAFT_137720 [Aspergillus coremiiformis]|uniref:Uncharacterized protein n=1 Tax=Aspergillus coremiiformis TaxID=138285 RepID=A0A5N6Z0H3_9EURO|nr:hypothetical protein BDV28DRAFT_137720 [Aspergillus coremiiformis]
MFHIFEKIHSISSTVVTLKNITEVREVIRLANNLDIPVWPLSKNRNVGYGSIGVDLGGCMNKVLTVDSQCMHWSRLESLSSTSMNTWTSVVCRVKSGVGECA